MTLAHKWQSAVCAAEPRRGCRLALLQPPAPAEEKRRKLKRTSADGGTEKTGQGEGRGEEESATLLC